MKAEPTTTSRRGEVVTMTSTEAQNAFGRVLDTVARDGTVLIKKHNVTQAVVMSVDRYEQLTRPEAPSLDALTVEFDQMLERMQRPEVQGGIRAGLSASPAELGEAARAAAQRALR
jgi:antitoxin Phd